MNCWVPQVRVPQLDASLGSLHSTVDVSKFRESRLAHNCLRMAIVGIVRPVLVTLLRDLRPFAPHRPACMKDVVRQGRGVSPPAAPKTWSSLALRKLDAETAPTIVQRRISETRRPNYLWNEMDRYNLYTFQSAANNFRLTD